MKINTILIILLCFSIVCYAGCQSSATPDNNEKNNNILTITGDGVLSVEECETKALGDTVMMLESKYCGHCKATLPDFEEACEEKGVKPVILDISEESDKAVMESHNVEIMYTPTFIIGCKYYIGAKQKEEYLQLLEDFLRGEIQ